MTSMQSCSREMDELNPQPPTLKVKIFTAEPAGHPVLGYWFNYVHTTLVTSLRGSVREVVLYPVHSQGFISHSEIIQFSTFRDVSLIYSIKIVIK